MKGENMSKPKAPYYTKDTSDTYHWETSCSNNHYTHDNTKPSNGWEKTNTKPSGKEQCDQCKSKQLSEITRFQSETVALYADTAVSQINRYT